MKGYLFNFIIFNSKYCRQWINAIFLQDKHNINAFTHNILDTTVCDRCTPVSSTNKTDRYDITEILLKSWVKHHDHNLSL